MKINNDDGVNECERDVQWKVVHRKSYCGNWVFCLFIYCRPMSHTLLWHFRCLIFYSLTLTEPIQKVNAHIVPHVAAQGWVHRKLLSLLPGNSQGHLSRAWGFAPGCGDRTVPQPGRLLPLRRQQALRMPSSLLQQHKEWAGAPPAPWGILPVVLHCLFLVLSSLQRI